jgi:hypothetical protein
MSQPKGSSPQEYSDMRGFRENMTPDVASLTPATLRYFNIPANIVASFLHPSAFK